MAVWVWSSYSFGWRGGGLNWKIMHDDYYPGGNTASLLICAFFLLPGKKNKSLKQRERDRGTEDAHNTDTNQTHWSMCSESGAEVP